MESLQKIIKLEKQLLAAKNTSSWEALINEDFSEITPDGVVLDKRQKMRSLETRSQYILDAMQFRAKPIQENTLLLTYLANERKTPISSAKISMHSSIWVQNDGAWQLTYHQASLMNIG